jgi:hypothetical protein
LKKIIILILGCVLICISLASRGQTNLSKVLENKLDQAVNYLKDTKDTPKVWELTVEISNIIKEHPEYDDGEIAEGIADIVSNLLTKPWKYASPYLIGNKSTASFRHFIVNHIDEFSPTDSKMIKKNISENCNQTRYPICKKIIAKI